MNNDKCNQLLNFPHVRTIFAALDKAGGESRFVGGCVRDTLMDKELVDVDLATDLLPQQVQQALNEARIKNLPLGIEHGTITAFIGKYSFEITTLRQDISTDGRRAVVKFTKDWQIDAYRRDFTINAMSYCPRERKLYDYATGVSDLEIGLIRFIGDPNQRVLEDYLRILRYFRFLAYFSNTAIDQPSFAACLKYRAKITNLSAERKSKEFFKILQAPNNLWVIELMVDVILLLITKVRADFIVALKAVATLEKKLGYGINDLLKLLCIVGNVKEATRELALTNKQKKYLIDVEKIASMITATAFRIDENDFSMLVFRYGNQLTMDGYIFWLLLFNKTNDLHIKQINQILGMVIKKLPISGQDIINWMHIGQGAEVGRLLQRAEEIWVRSGFRLTAEELLESLRGL